jgi:hypothetical protein
VTAIRRSEPISRAYVEHLLEGAAPERLETMKTLWTKYDPQFFLAEDGVGAQMSANSARVTFDNKTLSIYWLLSFAGWRTIECYSPAVLGSISYSNLIARRNPIYWIVGRWLRTNFPPGTTIADVVRADTGLATVEDRLNDYVYSASLLLRSDRLDEALWPAGIPRIGIARADLRTRQDKVTFDFACMSTAFAFCHELRHVMYAKDRDAPARPDEELQCDLWAREFLTAKADLYAESQCVAYRNVLAKRSMAAAIGIFVLYETTERSGDKGNELYPSIADRMNTTLGDTLLSPHDHFWVFYACVLVAIMRRRNHTPAVHASDAKQLCERLVEEIRLTS